MSARLSSRLAAKFILGSFKSEETSRQVSEVGDQLGAITGLDGKVLRAVAACRMGVRPEIAAKLLNWREFESFCVNLLRIYGFTVREDVHVRRPRGQLDIVAYGPSMILTIDCKHWKRQSSLSSLARFATAQLKRNSTLRAGLPDSRPIVSAIVTLSEQQERYVSGVAVVPLFALRNFLDTVAGYLDFLAQT